MNAVVRVLTLSLASTVSPEAQARREWEITTFSSFPKRPLALGLHKFTVRHPERVAKHLGIDFSPEAPPYIASGGISMVFGISESTVLKVIKESILVSDRQRQAIAAQQRERHLSLAEYLGDFTLPENVFIGTHPYMTNRQAVMISQPYEPGIEDTELFLDKPSLPMRERVAILSDRHPSAAARLPGFVEGSWALYDNDRLLPDTIGDGNLVTCPSGPRPLLIVDGQPITAQDEKAYLVLNHLEELGDALQAAA